MATEHELRDYLRRAAADLTESRREVAELRESHRELQRDLERDLPGEPIAVVGVACRFPGGAVSPGDYWELLREGRDGFGPIPQERWDAEAYYDERRGVPGRIYTRESALLEDVAGWDATLFGATPAEALRIDPHHRLLMELAWETFEDAGMPAGDLARQRVGVLVGLMDTQQYGRLEYQLEGPLVASDPNFGQGVTANVAAGRLAYHFDLRGPALTLDTACSSSLVAVHLAMRALRAGDCDLALASGVYLALDPDSFVQACATQQLSPSGRCRTFDAAADGYVLGEGAGMVMLERLSDAQRLDHHVHAVLRGSAVNQDGRSNGLTAPNRGAQVAVLRDALADAGLAPDDIDYLETHGSATALGDAIELSALHDVFGARTDERPLHLGAVKTNLGHTQSAAGIAGLIKAVLALEHDVLPASLGLDTPNHALRAPLRPLTEPVERGRAPWRAGVSSFGWSGTNAHVVLEAAPPVPTTLTLEPSSTVAAPRVLPVSGATSAALSAQLESCARWLECAPDTDLAATARTLARGRTPLEHRRALVETDLPGTVRALRAAGRRSDPGHRVHERPRVGLLLPGVGDQYAGLGRELYATDASYAVVVDECLALLLSESALDLRPALLSDDKAPTAPELAHPMLFVVEYALARWLADRGVRPDAMIGYSLGEYVAACLAGVLSLPDALRIVVARARLIETVAPGAMLALAADESTTRSAMSSSGARVDVAALNGPSMTVVSGTPDQVAVLAAWLRAEQVAHQPVRSSTAFHSSLLRPIRDDLATLLGQVVLHEPRIPIYSNATGARLRGDQATDPSYWADHLVLPVRLGEGLAHCLADGIDVLVELGPGLTLGGVVHRDFGQAGACVVATLPSPLQAAAPTSDEPTMMAECLARLWECGVEVDWSVVHPGSGPLAPAPTYAFQRSRFWPDGTPALVPPVPAAADSGPALFLPDWHRDPVARRDCPADRGELVVVAGPDQAPLGRALAQAHGGRLLAPGAEVGERATDPARGPLVVVHLATLPEGRPGATATRAASDYHHLADLVRETAGGLQPVRLLTVSRGAVDVVGADAVAPSTAAVHGLGRVAAREYPALRWSGVDLDPTSDLEAGLAAVGHELDLLTDPGPSDTAEVSAWRAGRRWCSSWLPAPSSDTAPADSPPADWGDDGVYLVTGGTRGLGLGVARDLAAHGARGLALVSRRATSSGADRTLLDALPTTSPRPEVLLLDADATDPASVRRALLDCREHFGALHGVVHAAGVPASGMLARQGPAAAETVLATKLGALGPLEDLLDEVPELTRVVLYSSAVTTLGAIGEADYCAANAVLDSFAQAMAVRHPQRQVTTIAWGPWQHDAWQGEAGGSELARRAADYRTRHGLTDAEGTALLHRTLALGASYAVAVGQSLEAAAVEWAAMLDLGGLTAASVPVPGVRHPRPELRVAYVSPRGEVEGRIAEVWQRFLGLEQVGAHDPFFDLGGNSLVGMATMLELERDLGVVAPPAVLFEHPTVADLAAALVASDASVDHPEDAPGTPSSLIAASTDRGRRRSQARRARKENVA